MKTNSLLLLGAIFTSWLFYGQSIGMNALFFTLLLLLSIGIQNHKLFQRKDILFFAATAFVGAISVFITGTGFSIGIWIASLFILIGSINGIQNSVYVRILNGIYVSTMGYVHHRINVGNTESKNQPITSPKEKQTGFIILTIAITILIVTLFAYLYAQANLLFESWMASIDLSFISINWIVFTILAFCVLKNSTSKSELDLITYPERAIDHQLKPSSKVSLLENQRSLILGTILISALCVLLIIFLFADISLILQNPLERAVELSRAVHKGVNALILSILIAITILLILFRGDFNFYKKNTSLKVLSVMWIVLNITLVILTAYKTYMYSDNYGLTYKRIGVFIYLFLCITGLVTAGIKIFQKKKLVYLFQTNSAIAFIILIMLANLNWSKIVTQFNITKVSNPDIGYLLQLDNSNSELLLEYLKSNPNLNQKAIIESRHQATQNRVSERSWQEFTLENFQK